MQLILTVDEVKEFESRFMTWANERSACIIKAANMDGLNVGEIVCRDMSATVSRTELQRQVAEFDRTRPRPTLLPR